jgi:alpha-beta hydrolase superfamily lysophospholipase
MKTGTIVLIMINLILPLSSNCRSEANPGRRSAQIDSTDLLPALKQSDENFKKNLSDNSSTHWYKSKNPAERNGVALVIHGLNCRPHKMESIIAELTTCGIECLNLSLRGHGENYIFFENTDSAGARMEAFKSVSYPLWKSEAYQAYELVKKKGNLYGTPVFFVGFSMGGLLGVDLFASNSNVNFDKMVLLAPALTMRQRNNLLKIFSPFPRLVIPSLAHASYLANRGTPMAAYNALFEMVDHLENNLNLKINVPTVVFVDKQDELISFPGLQEMVRHQKLDQWKIVPVKKDRRTTEIKMHHLIIDQASLGQQMWKEIVESTILHLIGKSAACAPIP